jgi:hypothetical protein
LIALIFNAHQSSTLKLTIALHVFRDRGTHVKFQLASRSLTLRARNLYDPAISVERSFSVFRRPGGISGEPEPDPISNSAVKLPCADDTKSQGLEK